MASRKRNEFLETEGSDDDDRSQGYDSEAEDVQKGGRNPKRRRLGSDESDVEEDEVVGSPAPAGDDNAEAAEDAEAAEFEPGQKRRTASELPKPLSKKNLVASAAAIKKSGVVYLSRIPPFMKPQKLRSLLEPYGAINRIFLTPEDPASHTRRVRSGGNKKRSFTDGWVEFVNKSDAKKACELLNAYVIGGKKGTYYHDDVWNLLYLRGFKWNNLTEQIAAENAERASRMRAEISKTTKENKAFVQNVEMAKMLDGMETKKAAKRKKADDEGKSRTDDLPKKSGDQARLFKQNTVAPKRKEGGQPEQVKRILSKIF